MRGFQKTMFTLAMFILVTQTVRHVYVKWFQDRTSVLDTYTKDQTDKEIEKAESLRELLAKYDPLKKKVDELDKQRKGMSEEESKKFKDEHSDEYKKESQVRYAIGDWESRSKEIRELRIFWCTGLCLMLIGAAVYVRRAEWFGMALIVPGASEMIWWTSPSFTWGGCPLEYDRLLNNKIFFSVIALCLLAISWVVLAWAEKRNSRTSPCTRPADAAGP